MPYPAERKKSEEVIRIITHQWCLKFGYMEELISDNDKAFTSEVFNEVLRYFSVKGTHGTPYSCASTSKVERANKRINTALRLTLSEGQLKEWDLYLPFVCFALNTIKSRHTGFSPNFCVFGRNLRAPLDWEVEGEAVTFSNTKSSQKAHTLFRTLRNIIYKARKHANVDFQYMDNAHNKRKNGPFFNQGDWCFTSIPCPKHKFSQRWSGPYEIVKKLDDHLYVVQLDNREAVVNIGKLKKYQKPKCNQIRPEAAEFVPNSETRPIVSKQPAARREEPAAIAIEITTETTDPAQPEVCPTEEAEVHPQNTAEYAWFDAMENEATGLIEPQSSDPEHTPQLRRSDRIRTPVQRYQAGF